MIDKMLKALKMTCKDVYPLISASQNHPLPFFGRIRLTMHLAICNLCKIYWEQLKIICRMIQSLGKDESKVFEATSLKPEVKEKIQKFIAEKN